MFDINVNIGPVVVGLTTDERMSLDLLDTLLNKVVLQAMILDETHLGNIVKYENYDNDTECEECQSLNEELD